MSQIETKNPLEDDNEDCEDNEDLGQAITKNTVPTERILQRTKLLFGSRLKSGYHRKSLKAVYESKRKSKVSFITDIG